MCRGTRDKRYVFKNTQRIKAITTPLSSTLTVNEHEFTLPDESVASHVTVVVPSIKIDPLSTEHTIDGDEPELSSTVGRANVTLADVELGAPTTTMF